jgi:hypothetical protein
LAIRHSERCIADSCPRYAQCSLEAHLGEERGRNEWGASQSDGLVQGGCGGKWRVESGRWSVSSEQSCVPEAECHGDSRTDEIQAPICSSETKEEQMAEFVSKFPNYGGTNALGAGRGVQRQAGPIRL